MASLVDKLKEGRVKRLVQAIINGDNLPSDIFDDDNWGVTRIDWD